ncbi:mechanosensitive ion channel [Parapedobacter sp. ISTM3]|uniref:Small-conductance mechanosensitive channel n=1 Tax=Parapedobacter luteus TaxID=623280 RepID=A0A1T5FDW4_9SPHI|nr:MULTISPECIES: mechanosensitive ion channel domain-containing protein [Parapedobacter]MBK1441427.1 mechanosensitive ion channel [Parapedobacter sp. ISTM3]SKB94379.1 Small-conductance mechanosensitive channel [Parapedobacter luteus]
MAAVSDIVKRRAIKERLFFIFKVVLWVVIAYSFATAETWYRDYPRVRQFAYGINTFLTGSVLISIGRFMFIALYKQRNTKNDRIRGNYVLGINQIAALLNVAFAVIGLMLMFGINPKEFLTSITIVAMAIALLFKDYITNMISGLLIMFSDQFTIGDNVRIGEHKGKIVDITLANIMVKNEDDDVVLIPNNTAFTANIINQSLQNSKKLSMDFELPLAHSYDHEALKNSLEEVVKQYGGAIVTGSFQFKVVGVGKDVVKYKLQFFTTKRDADIRRKVRSELYQRVIAYDAEQARSRSND